MSEPRRPGRAATSAVTASTTASARRAKAGSRDEGRLADGGDGGPLHERCVARPRPRRRRRRRRDRPRPSAGWPSPRPHAPASADRPPVRAAGRRGPRRPSRSCQPSDQEAAEADDAGHHEHGRRLVATDRIGPDGGPGEERLGVRHVGDGGDELEVAPGARETRVGGHDGRSLLAGSQSGLGSRCGGS